MKRRKTEIVFAGIALLLWCAFLAGGDRPPTWTDFIVPVAMLWVIGFEGWHLWRGTPPSQPSIWNNPHELAKSAGIFVAFAAVVLLLGYFRQLTQAAALGTAALLVVLALVSAGRSAMLQWRADHQ